MGRHKILIGACGLVAVLATSILVALNKPSSEDDFMSLSNLSGHTPVILTDEEVIYSDLSDAGYLVGKYAIGEQSFRDIGRLENFYMSSGMPVIANNTVYMSVTLSNLSHVLLKLDTSTDSLSSIPVVGADSDPLDSLAVMGDKVFILSHKRAEDGSYISTIRSFNDVEGETVCLELEMQDNSGQVISAFSCDEENLYAFVEDASESTVERYVNVYDSDFNVVQSLRIKNDSKIRHDNNIAQMYILGNYIYSRDYSDFGILNRISDGVLEPVLGTEGLRFSYNARNTDNTAYLLFLRGESKYYILDASTDSWLEGELALNEKESIRNAISDGDDFCFSILDDSIEDRFTTKDNYVYNYRALLKQTKPISVR
jgi:hypothetical protein